jgi:hypothetical protein
MPKDHLLTIRATASRPRWVLLNLKILVLAARGARMVRRHGRWRLTV